MLYVVILNTTNSPYMLSAVILSVIMLSIVTPLIVLLKL
jgi:hypothetical protein